MVWNPPLSFTYLEDRLARCCTPMSKNNALYCVSIKVERVINFSGIAFDSSVLQVFEEQGIRVQEVDLQKDEVSPSNLQKFQEWIALRVEDIISQCSHAFTLLVGNAETFLDCLVAACYRKVQEWAIIPIISEFRTFTFPFKLIDYEQMIELFDASLVDVETLAPEWHSIHVNIKAEEIKLQERCRKHRQILQKAEEYTLDEEGKEQMQIDMQLGKLFFNEPTKLITSDVVFDPTRSLVADKDDDD